MKQRGVVCFSIIFILSISLVSAGFFSDWFDDIKNIFGKEKPSFSPIAKELLEREEPIKIIEEPDSEETSGLIRPGDAGTEPEIIPEVIPEVIPEPEPEPNQTTNQTNITIIPEINETIIIPNITIPPETNQTNVTIIKNETNQTDPQLTKVPVAPLEELAIPKPPKLSYKKTYIGNIAIKDSTKPLETEYYIQNHLGSNIKVVGDEVEQNNEFYAFGEEKASSGDSYNQYKYTGKELDDETGLYYYGARYYDPNLGRFMAADALRGSIGDPLSLNRYSYVSNNPLKYIDPTGNVQFPGQGAATYEDLMDSSTPQQGKTFEQRGYSTNPRTNNKKTSTNNGKRTFKKTVRDMLLFGITAELSKKFNKGVLGTPEATDDWIKLHGEVTGGHTAQHVMWGRMFQEWGEDLTGSDTAGLLIATFGSELMEWFDSSANKLRPSEYISERNPEEVLGVQVGALASYLGVPFEATLYLVPGQRDEFAGISLGPSFDANLPIIGDTKVSLRYNYRASNDEKIPWDKLREYVINQRMKAGS